MLRTMANVVNLLVCRPHDENFRKLSTTNIEVPVPPLRSSFNLKHQQYMNQLELSPGVRNNIYKIFCLILFPSSAASPSLTILLGYGDDDDKFFMYLRSFFLVNIIYMRYFY